VRIFQVFDESTNTAVPGSNTWYRNLYEPLLDLGCTVTFLSARAGRVARQKNDPALRARFTEELLRTFKAGQRKSGYDLFFAYLSDGMVDPQFLDEVKKQGVPTCNFSCNNTHQFDLVRDLAPRFDYSLHSERDARAKFVSIGARPIWWPMAANPTYFKPKTARRVFDATFVGGSYALRPQYIRQLLDAGIQVQVFGPGWRFGARSKARSRLRRFALMGQVITAPSTQSRATAAARLAEFEYGRLLAETYREAFHEPASDDEVILLYSRSHISLGFLEVYAHHDPTQPVLRHLHLRDFEAPMCGALYCTGYIEELEAFFVPNYEVITYRSADELVDKVRFYLAHPTEAARIREAGRRRALMEHTYQARFRSLFAQLGFKLPCASNATHVN
jgi:spore maturation protein CgeB